VLPRSGAQICLRRDHQLGNRGWRAFPKSLRSSPWPCVCLGYETAIGRGFIAFLSAFAEGERQRITKRANDGCRRREAPSLKSPRQSCRSSRGSLDAPAGARNDVERNCLCGQLYTRQAILSAKLFPLILPRVWIVDLLVRALSCPNWRKPRRLDWSDRRRHNRTDSR
jgi:hypothetical protein